MVSRVVLAKLSPTMEEGTIVSWNRSEGDAVKVGDVLAVIETDKANMEMEALSAGVLRKILVPAGGTAPVGALIGVVADPEEDISAMLAEGTAAASPTPEPSAPVPVAPPPVEPLPASPEASPQPSAGRIKASPLARRMAVRDGFPLSAIAGSGPGGRVIKRDVEAFAKGDARRPTGNQEIPLSGMRKAIARRLSESARSAPHYFVSMEVDMDAAVALRDQILAVQETKVSYNDFLIKICAAALPQFPMVNASWAEDRIVTHGDVHIGVAVALPDGLITPVIRHADRKGLLEIAREAKDLAARARQKALRPDEYQGSTFTLSNLGMFDVHGFTAIINPPESAILAVGAVRRVPVVDGDAIRPGHRLMLTMRSADHRVVDGAQAAQFLREVRRRMENPVSVLL